MPGHVKLPFGAATLAGTRRNGVTRFGALRYALPPVGRLRFAAPVPARLQGEVDATGTGPVPPQLPAQLSRVMGPFEAPQSEDCLHLTVWTPAADGQRRPVVVWCHGGAWQSGGVVDWYDGEALARRGDVVVVGVSARLGVPGWLLAEGGTANLGLLDLELAFDWVAEHIAAFGGDPARITAMGQSSGGVNIAALAMRGAPRFQRAILQSAPLGRRFRSTETALAVGRALLRATVAQNLEQARGHPMDAFLRAQQAPEVLAAVREQADGHGVFAPVLDGETLAGPPSPLASSAPGRVDVLVGWNRDEMRAFPASNAATGDDEALQRFEAPARRWAEQATHAGHRAWLYRFDGPPGLPFGACHCAELPFVFGTFDAFAAAPMLAGVAPGESRRLMHDLQGAWLDFVHGRPLPWAPGPHVHAFA